MPSIKYRELSDQWRELESHGVPLEPMEYRAGRDPQAGRGLVIDQIGDCSSNVIFELEDHRIAYVLNTSILCDLPGETYPRGWGIEAPWDERFFEPLSDPAEDGHRNAPYAFSEKYEYPRKDVINHRLRRVLRRGGVCEGLLLGVSWARLPETYREGAEIPIILNIFDQWERAHSSPFTMPLVQRIDPHRSIRRKNARGLLSKREPIFSLDELKSLSRRDKQKAVI